MRERIDNRTFEVDSFLDNNTEFWNSADELVAYHESKSDKKRIKELSEEVETLNEKIDSILNATAKKFGSLKSNKSNRF